VVHLVKNQVGYRKVEKDEVLIDGVKSAMMTMRRRPLADRSRLALRQSHFTVFNGTSHFMFPFCTFH